MSGALTTAAATLHDEQRTRRKTAEDERHSLEWTTTNYDSTPKGAAFVLEERGYNTRGMKLGEMRAILADHDDFKNEKCRVDTFLSNSGHTCV